MPEKSAKTFLCLGSVSPVPAKVGQSATLQTNKVQAGRAAPPQPGRLDGGISATRTCCDALWQPVFVPCLHSFQSVPSVLESAWWFRPLKGKRNMPSSFYFFLGGGGFDLMWCGEKVNVLNCTVTWWFIWMIPRNLIAIVYLLSFFIVFFFFSF